MIDQEICTRKHYKWEAQTNVVFGERVLRFSIGEVVSFPH